VELFSFTLMPNHWHLHRHGYGHLYQSWFKSFPVQSDEHFYVVCRYVERNPLRANLVASAEDWPHGSLYRWCQRPEPMPTILSKWPIPRLRDWVSRLNAALTEKELDAMRMCVNRDRPFSDEIWTDEIAGRQRLWYTMRPVGRPRKQQSPQP